MEQHFEVIGVGKSQLLQMHQNIQLIRITVCRFKNFKAHRRRQSHNLWAFLVRSCIHHPRGCQAGRKHQCPSQQNLASICNFPLPAHVCKHDSATPTVSLGFFNIPAIQSRLDDLFQLSTLTLLMSSVMNKVGVIRTALTFDDCMLTALKSLISLDTTHLEIFRCT